MKNYIENINVYLRQIQNDYEEMGNDLESIITSEYYNKGAMLVMYGKILKVLHTCKDYDSTIQELEKLRKDGNLDDIYDVICMVQDAFIKALKENQKFDNINFDMWEKIEHEYLLDTILK